MHNMISNILKKIMVNTLAIQFSWAMKGKLIFKDLIIAKIIMRMFIFIKCNIFIHNVSVL